MNLTAWLAHDPKSPLLFNSGTFLVLFSCFIAVYALLSRHNRARIAWIVAFSLYYYYRSNGIYTLALVALAATDFGIALRLHREQRPWARKVLLTTSVTLNLLGLGFFKYTNFVLGSFATLLGRPYHPFDIFLPLGISFHVFQSISYLVDIYRRKLAPTRSFLEYVAFLCFFPQLVAGPIVRAEEFFSQARPLRSPTEDDIAQGLFRILKGLLKKAVVADFVGRYADLVFGAPRSYGGPEVLLATYAYSVQIYFDFSGYSDLALGLSRLLGVRIPENFDSPYRATSITDFWRRWHISLSTWLREYLYISLGGNRRGPVRKSLNLFITMLLGGLWHGASWTFVIWGGLHGLFLSVEKALGLDRYQSDRSPLFRALSWVVTFHGVAALWVVFRAPTLTVTRHLLARLSQGWSRGELTAVLAARRETVFVVALGLAVSLLPRNVGPWLAQRFRPLPTLVKLGAFALVAECVVQVASKDVQPFIYFQF